MCCTGPPPWWHGAASGWRSRPGRWKNGSTRSVIDFYRVLKFVTKNDRDLRGALKDLLTYVGARYEKGQRTLKAKKALLAEHAERMARAAAAQAQVTPPQE